MQTTSLTQFFLKHEPGAFDNQSEIEITHLFNVPQGTKLYTLLHASFKPSSFICFDVILKHMHTQNHDVQGLGQMAMHRW